MEVYMSGIGPNATKNQVISAIARVLHSNAVKPNFDVYLFRDKRPGGRGHSGTGALTLPSEDLGRALLRQYGGLHPRRPLIITGKKVRLEISKRVPRPEVVERVRRLPYLDPSAVEAKEKKAAQLQSETVAVRSLQFGWECRDEVFSVEWERHYDVGVCELSFEDQRRELRVKILRTEETLVIAIRFSQINSTSWTSSPNEPAIYFSLATAPAFESEVPPHIAQEIRNRPDFRGSIYDYAPRLRLTSLDEEHSRVAPYTSLAFRIVCRNGADISLFRRLSRIASLSTQEFGYPIERRERFSASRMERLNRWLLRQAWEIAFQVQALLQAMLLDFKEMLDLRPDVERVTQEMGTRVAASFLQHFAMGVKFLWAPPDESREIQRGLIRECFHRSEAEFRQIQVKSSRSKSKARDAVETFDCLHVSVTPTSMILTGPYPERSNRVMRTYPNNHDSFLRVSFVDEDGLQYRFDREVNGAAFIQFRVGTVLKHTLTVAGRPFQFLAYSQSALKEHAVVYVKPFYANRVRVDAATIIRDLGSFENLEFDPMLMYCPARYGARISQAFTATDTSVAIEAEEIMPLPDVKRNSWTFTDGVGTISPELARDIWKQLRAGRKRNRRTRDYPRSFQVRFMGSKGMLSVDYRLSGRAICLRPSMIKFEAPESRQIEIARAFDRPGKYYLNRPLIMLLEGLGVPYEVFKRYQDMAVRDAQESAYDLARAARFLESYGLGTSFKLPSVMLSLHHLGITSLHDEDIFFDQMMAFAVNHVLRDLKQHARIPIPKGVTLVGVADTHKHLRAGEIFACTKSPDDSRITYLEGPVLISRSPTIHPGDVQVAYAIGRPPADSCFAREPLPNTVVFSVLGDRPLPSCLGGGDLDGDTYNLICLNDVPEFSIRHAHPPASYAAAPRKVLDRVSTMEDVGDFIVDYINSDVLGIIAINWLIIADQSRDYGIHDPDCMKLSQLHSDAVDFQKSGQPVALEKIPKLKFKARPDWNAPETLRSTTADYYESERAIGKLFRAIDLPAPRIVKKVEHAQRSRLDDDGQTTVESLLEDFHLGDMHDQISEVVRRRASAFISTRHIDHETSVSVAALFSRYAADLAHICSTHTLSYHRAAMLTEEEAIIGTIVAKCAQPRYRKDTMSKLREQTDILVRSTREDLTVDEDLPLEGWLENAWAAWVLATNAGDSFGAKSFGWIALSSLFEAIKAIEDDERGY